MAKPLGQMPYQTVGDLVLIFSGMTNFENYRCELNLDTATATIHYRSDGVNYTREVFASAPDNVIVTRLMADKPGKLSFSAGMKTRMSATVETDGNNTLLMRGTGGSSGGIRGRIKYQAQVNIKTKGGKTTAENGSVSVIGADEATC